MALDAEVPRVVVRQAKYVTCGGVLALTSVQMMKPVSAKRTSKAMNGNCERLRSAAKASTVSMIASETLEATVKKFVSTVLWPRRARIIMGRKRRTGFEGHTDAECDAEDNPAGGV